jgi:HSP20 family protein
VVRADLPGMSKDDINVEITDDALVIRGERRSEREENEEGYYRSERSYGSFYRRIPLPEGVSAENANATFRNGMLEITMLAPQRAEQQRRQLEIREGTEDEQQSRAKQRAAGEK